MPKIRIEISTNDKTVSRDDLEDYVQEIQESLRQSLTQESWNVSIVNPDGSTSSLEEEDFDDFDDDEDFEDDEEEVDEDSYDDDEHEEK